MKQYIKRKIDEYVTLLAKCGYIANYEVLNEIRNKLNSLNVEKIFNAPGDAVIDGSTLKICVENIERNINLYGTYYFDEVLFHEFSHAINSFHSSVYGEKSFIISKYVQNRMNNFTTVELLEQVDELLYNQDPCFGVLLLDEFIAQNISQKLVMEKLNSLNNNLKNKYISEGALSEYKDRYFTSRICEPPMNLKTSLAVYPEFDIFAKKFINKYGYSEEGFIKKSLQNNFLKDFINRLNSGKIEDLYIDLCYLGLIQQRVYLLRGFAKIDDKKDPAYDPKKMYLVMNKILKR